MDHLPVVDHDRSVLVWYLRSSSPKSLENRSDLQEQDEESAKEKDRAGGERGREREVGGERCREKERGGRQGGEERGETERKGERQGARKSKQQSREVKSRRRTRKHIQENYQAEGRNKA
jgi:hypothetical protein